MKSEWDYNIEKPWEISMRHITKELCLAAIFTLLTACTLLHTTKEEDREARCRLLKRDITFNAATADQAQAGKERAELETLMQNYHDEDCDQFEIRIKDDIT